MRTESMNLASIFNMETVSKICCPQAEEVHTAYEWDKILDTGIIDYDGFRDGTITTETKMAKEEFQRRAVQATRRFVEPEPEEEEFDEEIGYGISLHRDFEREE